MDVLQLHYFRTLYEYGSYQKASSALYISRQGLAKVIQKLEEEIDGSLFDVTNNGVVATALGNLLYAKSKEYIQFHRQFLQSIVDSKPTTQQELTIGLTSGFSEGLGPNFLSDFIIHNPDLVVRVHSYPAPSIKTAMEHTTYPIWIVTSNYNDALFRPLYTQTRHLVLLVSKDHPLTKLPSVHLSDIAPYRLIGLTHDIGQKGRVNTAINTNHLKEPEYYLNASDRDLIMHLVQSGLAISFNAGWHYQRYPGIVALSIDDLDIAMHVYVLLRNDISIDSSIQRFIDYLTNYTMVHPLNS